MYLQHLNNLIVLNNLNRADLSRLAHVSRATVTKWFKQGRTKGWANAEMASVISLAKSLNLPSSLFLEKRPLLSMHQTHFLWDFLYPNMESFVKALSEFRLPAVARLTQVVGFHEALQLLGKKVILKFNNYKKFIKPARRKQLEVLWPLYNSQILLPSHNSHSRPSH